MVSNPARSTFLLINQASSYRLALLRMTPYSHRVSSWFNRLRIHRASNCCRMLHP